MARLDEADIEGGLVIGTVTSRSARKFARLAKLYFVAQVALVIAGVVSLICSDKEVRTCNPNVKQGGYDFLWTLWVAFGCLMLLQAHLATVHYRCSSGQVHSKAAVLCVMMGMAVFFSMARTEGQDNGLRVASGVFFVGGILVLNFAAANSMLTAFRQVKGAQCSGVGEFSGIVYRCMVSRPDDSVGSSTTAVTPADVQRTPAKKTRVAAVPPVRPLFAPSNHVMAKGVEDKSDANQFFCPICMLFYASIYRTSCCVNYVCDHCTPQFVKGMSQADDKADTLESTSDCPYCNKADLRLERVRRGETARRYDDSPHVKSKIAGAAVGDPAQSPLKVGDSFEAMKKKMIGFDGRSFSKPFSTPRKQDKVYPASTDGPPLLQTPAEASVAIPENRVGGSTGAAGTGTGTSLPGTPDDLLPSPTPGGSSPTPPYSGTGAQLPPRSRGPRPLLPVFMSAEMESVRPTTPSGIGLDASAGGGAAAAGGAAGGEAPAPPQTPSPGREVAGSQVLTESSPITPGAVEVGEEEGSREGEGSRGVSSPL